jgi:hypothetical protein
MVNKFLHQSNFLPENGDYQHLYASILSCNYKKDLDEGTCLTYENYGKLSSYLSCVLRKVSQIDSIYSQVGDFI